MVAFGIDDIEILAGDEAQAEVRDALLDDDRATDQHRTCQTIIDHRLYRTQHRRFLTFRVHQTFTVLLGALEHGLHQQHGLEHEFGKLILVGSEIGNRPSGHSTFDRGLGHRRGEGRDQPWVEGLGDQILRSKFEGFATVGGKHHFRGLLHRQLGERLHTRQLHLLCNRGGANIQRATKNIREAQHIVDLVRIIRAAGGDYRIGARGINLLWHDLGRGICQRQDDRLRAHRRHHRPGQHFRAG